ncbi:MULTISPECIES: Gfo/Idh/MocA family protein [unclassified Sphingobacterium]|uniref:Gfo/Idh/MocA family protein n=1 Tax=unclassified Sphingobacterium TaxID=2609468 RepID=UPI00265CC6BA|nr:MULTISPECIES: Gfo/Idh/MocA family oxidoreductase [unclassified Sphingobacterium]WKK60167.1 Gfo/Idh/MocA family oxidoreductase [Sphingobacterium sp. BN32]
MSTDRRSFLKLSGLAGLGILSNKVSASPLEEQSNYHQILRESQQSYKPIFNMSGYAAPALSTVRTGFVGVGNRGSAAVYRLSMIEGVSIKGICDIRDEKAQAAKKRIVTTGHEAKIYSGKAESWKEMCRRDDIDFVYIATNWALHAEMAIYAMEQGKHVAVEIPAAVTIEECWQLVMTSERTKKHCVILENCCYDFFEMLTLNLARQGFFGDIVHCEGAYIHDILESLFKDEARYDKWRLMENAKRNGNLYPTHGLGPIAQVLKINRGNKMEFMTSMASKDFSLRPKTEELAKTNKEFEKYLKYPFRGNMNTSTIKNHDGSTIMLQHDVSTPRPYSRIHLISGTKAFAQKYPLPAKLAIGHEKFLDEDEFKKIEAENTPKIISQIGEMAKEVGGHGGMDFIMDWRLIDCLRNGLPVDMDVYDAASWSSIGPLSEWSVANGSKPIAIPDFTMGRWKANKVHNIHLETGGNTKVLKSNK